MNSRGPVVGSSFRPSCFSRTAKTVSGESGPESVLSLANVTRKLNLPLSPVLLITGRPMIPARCSVIVSTSAPLAISCEAFSSSGVPGPVLPEKAPQVDVGSAGGVGAAAFEPGGGGGGGGGSIGNREPRERAGAQFPSGTACSFDPPGAT